jgi:hypothetical protein
MADLTTRLRPIARRRSAWLAACALLLIALAGHGGRAALAQDASDVSVNVEPPALPEYDQPPIPGEGYVWAPGYWAWSDDDQDYYWVPGTWVAAPEIGYLWTPGYWFADGGVFVWYPGYWGPHVGFYGGIDYGHGYGGRGYDGGYWQGSHLFYNRAASNLGSAPIANVYEAPLAHYGVLNRSSFNGGAGGVQVQPSPAELAAAREPHLGPTVQQHQHEDTAHGMPTLRAGVNRGVPPVAATAHPGELNGAGAIAARRDASAPARAPAPAALAPGAGASVPPGASARLPAREPEPSGAGSAPRSIPAPPPARPAAPRPPVPKPKEDHDHREP